MKKLLIIFISFGAIWFTLHTFLTIRTGLKNKEKKANIAIVFGCKVHKNGLSSRSLAARLNKTIELYHKGYFPKVIVSGGDTGHGYNEAKVMANYLIKHKVPKSAIIEDTKSHNTYATVRYFANSFYYKSSPSFIVISQYYHLPRISLAFYKYNIKVKATAYPKYFKLSDIYSLFREFFAYYKYLLIKE